MVLVALKWFQQRGSRYLLLGSNKFLVLIKEVLKVLLRTTSGHQGCSIERLGVLRVLEVTSNDL